MFSKRKLNLIISFVILTACLFGILLSNKDSSLTSPFSAKLSPAPDNTGDVEGASTNVISNNDNPDLNADNSIENLSTNEGQEVYQVVKVVDGDTLEVNIDGPTKIRVIGIDTPETVDPRKPVQCFGKEASNKAKEILTGQFVSIVADESQGDKDKYGRLLRYVYLPNGMDYGLQMISEGYAHEYTYRTPYQHQAAYKQAEIDARNGNKGLWSPNTCSGNK